MPVVGGVSESVAVMEDLLSREPGLENRPVVNVHLPHGPTDTSTESTPGTHTTGDRCDTDIPVNTDHSGSACDSSSASVSDIGRCKKKKRRQRKVKRDFGSEWLNASSQPQRGSGAFDARHQSAGSFYGWQKYQTKLQGGWGRDGHNTPPPSGWPPQNNPRNWQNDKHWKRSQGHWSVRDLGMNIIVEVLSRLQRDRGPSRDYYRHY